MATNSLPEQIRPCLKCGELNAFSSAQCRACGFPLPLAATEQEGRVKFCMGCEAIIAFDEIYCGSCNELSVRLTEPEIPPLAERRHGLHGVSVDLVAVCLACLGSISLLLALLDRWRG